MEELGFFFPVHISTEVWTHRKYIITSLPRAGESWQRLYLFWVRAEETVPSTCPHTMIPQEKKAGMLAQLGKHIYPFALFQQDLTRNLWFKCSGHGSSQEKGDLPPHSGCVSIGLCFFCGQKVQPLAYMLSVLLFSYRYFHLTPFINQQLLLSTHPV